MSTVLTPPEESLTPEPVPDWLMPPPQGFTAEDLDRLTGLPPHTELIDGSLVLVSPQVDYHALAISLLETALRRQAPDTLRARREMTVRLGKRQRPEPDLLLIRADADPGPKRTFYQPSDVLLVAEVVSEESAERDRKRKPQLYAKAGIPHFWLVEIVNGALEVHVYQLDEVTESYAPLGMQRDRLELPTPFPMDIDLTELQRM
ncbi:Uma2 family endonuclease [Streptacidiphilus sp. EB103A]|uniref:Uma2 family endonuclease n=1 Tax=Streptacidiphilus sp. EB103A TaxID=3156275 RepID=UPI0035144A8D